MRWLILLIFLVFLIAHSLGTLETESSCAEEGGKEEQEVVGEVLALPASDEKESGSSKLELGEKITFDSLGPMIMTKDGTIRRITNWDKLSEREREWTLQRIAARNKARAQEFQKNQINEAHEKMQPAKENPE